MKGDAKIIDLLNEVLTGELTAVNQYFLHSRMCRNWGYRRLASHIHKESIDEMKHADELIERVLFLEGLPNVQRLGKVMIGQTAHEILKNDLAVEMHAIPLLNRGMQACRDAGDNGSEILLGKSSTRRRSTWTGSRRNSRSSRRSASKTIFPSKFKVIAKKTPESP